MTNSVTLNGNTYNDGTTPPRNMGAGGHRDNLIPMLADAVADLAAKQAAAATANGVLAITYTFDSATADVDPGSGKLRVNNATQNAATSIFSEVLDSTGTDWTSVLDTFDASTSTVKGQIRLSKVADGSKWLTFNVTARTTATGYRKLTVTNTGSSSASPFANGDSILLSFTRTGDKGATGAPYSGSVTTSGLTQSTGKLLGRSTAGAGAIEEITVGSGLSLSGGALIALPTGVGDHEVAVYGGNGYGSTNNVIRRFTTTMTNVGTAITYADSATLGATFTVNETGIYEIFYSEASASAADYGRPFGASVNSTQLTTAISSISVSNRLVVDITDTQQNQYSLSRTVKLIAGDVVRAHTDGGPVGTSNKTLFSIRKVGNV